MYRQKKEGILATVLFHLIIVAILLFFGLSVPLPLPEEKGILLDFGTSETGSGQIEPTEETAVQPIQQQVSQAPSNAAEKQVMTQDFEDAPVIEKKKEKPKTTEKPTQTENEKPAEKKPEKKPEREVNKRALFPGKSQTDNVSEGITGNQGNQGSESGMPEANNYQTGESFGGGGISYSLSGRNPVSLPTPEYNYQEEGIVVVSVTVNRNGEVIKAVPGVKGSTTLDTYLCEMARKAALKAKFTSKSGGTVYQQGTISYHFILK